MNIEYLNDEQRVLLIKYQKEFLENKKTMGVDIARAEFERKVRENISLPDFRKGIKQDFIDGSASGEKTARRLRKASDQETAARESLLEHPEMTQQEKEEYIRAVPDSVKSGQQLYAEVIAEEMPENITKEKAEEILEATTEYAIAQRGDIMDHVREGNYSEDFKSEIISKCSKIHADAIKQTRKFIQHFWETDKGRAIVAYTKRVMENLKEQKEKYVEKREEANVKIEAAQEAEKAAELAKEEATKAKKKAEAIVEDLGLRNLQADAMKKVLKLTSPKEFRKLEEAEYKQKQAYWAEFEANIEKENAIHNAMIAAKMIAIIKSTATALMRMAQSSFGV